MLCVSILGKNIKKNWEKSHFIAVCLLSWAYIGRARQTLMVSSENSLLLNRKHSLWLFGTRRCKKLQLRLNTVQRFLYVHRNEIFNWKNLWKSRQTFLMYRAQWLRFLGTGKISTKSMRKFVGKIALKLQAGVTGQLTGMLWMVKLEKRLTFTEQYCLWQGPLASLHKIKANQSESNKSSYKG